MKRPLEHKRPIGPFAMITPEDGELTDREIEKAVEGLARTLTQKVEALEEAENARRPDPTAQDIATDLAFNRQDMDGAVKKLSAKYKGRTRPNGFAQYQKQAEIRDDMLEDYN